MMASQYFLEIQFLSFREKPEINKVKFNDQIYEVILDSVKKIELPKLFFEEDESKNSSLKLLKDSELINECIVEILKGANYFYCFLDEKGYTFQLLFFNIEPTIKIPLYKDNYYNITKYDSNQTVNRKRFTFINANFFSLLIGEQYFSIPSYTKDLKSHQLCVYDLEKKLILTKPLLLEENDNFINIYYKYITEAYQFNQEITSIISQKNKKKIRICLNKYKDLGGNIFFLNKSKSKLSKILNNYLYIDFYTYISLYKIIKILQDSDSLNEMIKYYLEKINEITKDESLQIYQKILLIECFNGLFYVCKSREELEKASFTYYIMVKKEDNSVLDLIEKFFKEYREKLTEKSPVFMKLIELDGDSGVYENESFYCFNMQNLEELRKHLKEIETNILTIHDLNNKNLASSDMYSGIVSVNIHYIKQFKSLDIPLDKKLPENKKEIGEIIVTKIIYNLLHEINGHKKFAYKKNKNIKSPKKFIENGNIFTLAQKDSNLKGENIIKIVPNNSIGEDSYFYELCYGKIIDYYTFEIMDNLEDFSDLLYEVDLWVNNLEQLRECVKYKFILQQYGSNFKSKKKTIKEKINDYKNECMKLEKEKKIYIDTFFKKEKSFKYKKKTITKETFGFSNSNKGKSKSDDFHFSKENIKINEENPKTIEKEGGKNFEMEEDEIIGENENESEEEEEEETEKKINEQEKEEILIHLPDESLLALKKAGILTGAEVDIYSEKKRKLSMKTFRYASEIGKNS